MEKKMKIIKIMILILAAIPFIISDNILAQEAEPEQISSDDLSQTAITCYLQEKMSEGENLLYCSAFQIAWDELCNYRTLLF